MCGTSVTSCKHVLPLTLVTGCGDLTMITYPPYGHVLCGMNFTFNGHERSIIAHIIVMCKNTLPDKRLK